MSTTVVWCPYSGEELDLAECSPEHIIPLSLGGSNRFTVPVSAELNSKVGSAIDGALATKDVMTLFRRREFDARGHNNKKPEVRIKNATYGVDQRPAQVTLGGKDRTKVWDAMSRSEVPEEELVGQRFQLNITIKPYDRIRFLAKVSLAAGYAIYGDLFRATADHSDLRTLMLAETIEVARQVLVESNLRGCFEYSRLESKDAEQTRLHQAMCESVSGSVVMSVPTSDGLLFTVGLLGQWVGTMNVPAKTDSYPNDGTHDLGHVTLLVDGGTEQISVREFARLVYEARTGHAPPESGERGTSR